MKRLSVLLLIAGMALVSCRKDNRNDEYLTGTYKGTFQRFGPAVDGQLVNVTLKFDGNTFSGESEAQYYPAICSGKFTVAGNKANFENTCVWPAHFDWTLILNGEYEIIVNGNNLEIIRSYNGVVFYQDHYKLIKE
jgi:hypothetical protein